MKQYFSKNKKKAYLILKYEKEYNLLKSILKNKNFSNNILFTIKLKLDELPKNSLKVKFNSRCIYVGRAHSTFRKFFLSRLILKNLIEQKQLPGWLQSTW